MSEKVKVKICEKWEKLSQMCVGVRALECGLRIREMIIDNMGLVIMVIIFMIYI